MLGGYGASFLDGRGKLVARSYDILGGVEFFLLLHSIVRSQFTQCSSWFMQACIQHLYSRSLIQMQYHRL